MFLNSLFNELGINDVLNRKKSDSRIKYDLTGITKMLVFERILNPTKQKKTFENRNKYLFPIVDTNDLDEVYKTLTVLENLSKTIQNRMNTKIKKSSIGRITI